MLTLAQDALHEEEVKHSRFLARARSVETPEQALAFLEEVREAAANHNCWAYRIGELYRFSDDGEPGGTAGRPILAAIDRHGTDHVMVVVTRYFGGIKLGAGGLARAYGGAAATCLRLASLREVLPLARLRLMAPFDATGAAYEALRRCEAEVLAERYEPSGLCLDLRVAESRRAELEAELRELSRGAARLSELPDD